MSLKQDLFESEENTLQWTELLQTLKVHPFESPWANCFHNVNEDKGFRNEVFEFSANQNVKTNSKLRSDDTFLSNHGNNSNQECFDTGTWANESKICKVKQLLMTPEEVNSFELAKDLDILLTFSLSQVSEFCKFIDVCTLNEAGIALLFNGITCLEKQLSLGVASTLVKYFMYPQVSRAEETDSRTLLTSILSFTEVYPKAMIDEVIIPCLNKGEMNSFEAELLFKMAKCNLPEEYITYCIRNILEQEIQLENAFSIMQSLIERKVHHDQNLHDLLARKMHKLNLKFCTDIKFTKLLTSILSTYGAELTEQYILIYDDIVKGNKTVVKKAAENIMKKIKLKFED